MLKRPPIGGLFRGSPCRLRLKMGDLLSATPTMDTPFTPFRRAIASTGLVAAAALLSGCEYLGIETPAAEKTQQLAEGKAIGGACRHANRALEDCYRYNPKAVKSAVFEGWKEMDVYMRENNLQTISPETPAELPKPKAPPKPVAKPEEGEESGEADAGHAGKASKAKS